MYLRFVVGGDAENAAWLTGIITEARILNDQGELFRHESQVLEEAFEWFNERIPCPPFQRKIASGEWTRDAVCWFRDDAKAAVKRVWDIVAILREHGVPVRLVTTEKPGRIVYSDRYQVVAETLPWA